MKTNIPRYRRVRLRSVEEKDYTQFSNWCNDTEVIKFINLKPMTSLERESWYKAQVSNQNNYYLSIEAEEGILLGYIALEDINRKARNAKLVIFLGRKECQDKGYGQEAICAFLKIVFTMMNLDEIYLEVFRCNHIALRCFEKCGFRYQNNSVGHRDSQHEDPFAIISMKISKKRFFRLEK